MKSFDGSIPPGQDCQLRQPHASPARGMALGGLTQLCHLEGLARMPQLQTYDQHAPGGFEEGLSDLLTGARKLWITALAVQSPELPQHRPAAV